MLLSRRILFFGGKGGVGKTTLASALALRAADTGRRTLLVSTDPAHSTSDLLGVKLGGEIRSVSDSLDALELDPAEETRRYIDDVKARIEDTVPPRISREVDRQIEAARVSPGAEESALFERFARVMTESIREYDLTVFDTAPTGHTLRLLSLPELMGNWIGGLVLQRQRVGALRSMWHRVRGSTEAAGDDDPVLRVLEERRRIFESARDILKEPRSTAFVFVVTPERLPILETRRAVETLEKAGIPLGPVFVNRVLPRSEDSEFLRARQAAEAVHLSEIEEHLGSFGLFHIPLQPRDVTDMDALRSVAHLIPPEALTDPLRGEGRE